MGLSLEDKDAIRDVLTVYAHAIDRRRWDLMPQLFHPDGTFAFGPVQGGWQQFVEQARGVIEPCVATHHQLGQVLITADGPDAAQAETYMTAMHIVPAGYPLTTVFPDRGEDYSAIIAGRYVDRLVRHDGGWRIMQRIGIYDWREFRTIGEASLSAVPDDARGAHHAGDPAWAVAQAFY
ncbi:nuclear transport factor 2 family protein [Novosphingobium sp.]|uniref:nuclear transport factor 2 family protein n=1 Tax=Novosphingobium sp. TaxID=1874826 RepID=UPI0025CE0E56|nr:nuclear transport factor 2 family protein [Novosphingobium sp.]